METWQTLDPKTNFRHALILEKHTVVDNMHCVSMIPVWSMKLYLKDFR